MNNAGHGRRDYGARIRTAPAAAGSRDFTDVAGTRSLCKGSKCFYVSCAVSPRSKPLRSGCEPYSPACCWRLRSIRSHMLRTSTISAQPPRRTASLARTVPLSVVWRTCRYARIPCAWMCMRGLISSIFKPRRVPSAPLRLPSRALRRIPEVPVSRFALGRRSAALGPIQARKRL